jgi:hypothetical protein
MVKIALISYSFPPAPAPGSVRPGKFYKYFLEYGWDCLVISEHLIHNKSDIFSEPPVAQDKRDGVAGKSKNGKLIVIGKLSLQWLRRKLIALLTLTGWSGRTDFHFPDPQLPWYIANKKGVVDQLREFGPDLIISSFPPVSSHRLASYCAKRLDVPWIADYRDEWSTEQYSRPRKGLWKFLDVLIERSTVKSAKALITVSAPIAESLKSLHHKNVYIMENGFDGDDYPAVSEMEELRNKIGFADKFNITFTGGLSTKNDILPFFDGLEAFMRSHEEARGKVCFNLVGTVPEKFREMVETKDFNFRVNFVGRVSYKESLVFQKCSDLLLMPEWRTAGAEGVYTSKIFTYLGSRVPVLFIGSNNHIIAELLQKTGAGWTVQTAEEVENVVSKVFFNKVAGIESQILSDPDRYSHKELIFNLCAFIEAKVLR